MMLKKNRKGQTLIEYAMLITIILGVFVAVQIYVKRGIQGRWKAAVDDLGDQYDPLMANTSVRHTIDSNTMTTLMSHRTDAGYWTRRTDDTSSVEKKKGYIGVGGYE